MNAPLILLVALGIALSGCSAHVATANRVAPGAAVLARGPSAPPQIAPAPTRSFLNDTAPKIELSGCTAFDAIVGPFPGDLGPGSPPAGWAPRDPTQASHVYLLAYACNRVAAGPYERPASFVFDGHDRADIPSDCSSGLKAPSHVMVLGNLLVNDADLAAYLDTAFGLPARYAEIHQQAQPVGTGAQHAWAWGLPGKAASNLTVLEDGQMAPYQDGDRIYWQRLAGIGVLDFTYTREGPLVTSRAGDGWMQPPMLLASMPKGFFASTMDVYPALSGEGNAHFFKDAACKQPAGP